MDQPISCQEIYHIYKHPLSILIHLKYQDKDGCSRNGFLQFLFTFSIALHRQDLRDLESLYNIGYDHRGCMIFLKLERRWVEDLSPIVLEMKNVSFDFNFHKSCDVPTVDEEEMNVLDQALSFVFDEKDQWCLNHPFSAVNGFNDVVVSNGHVITLNYEGEMMEDHFLFNSLLPALPHLKSLFLHLAPISDYNTIFDQKFEGITLLQSMSEVTSLSSLSLQFRDVKSDITLFLDTSLPHLPHLRILKLARYWNSGFAIILINIEVFYYFQRVDLIFHSLFHF